MRISVQPMSLYSTATMIKEALPQRKALNFVVNGSIDRFFQLKDSSVASSGSLSYLRHYTLTELYKWAILLSWCMLLYSPFSTFY